MNREQLQEKLHKMQKDQSYRLFTYSAEDGVKSMPDLKGLSCYLIMTDSEWFARNGDQQLSSNNQSQDRVLFAETCEKLFLPKAENTALYISPNHPATSCCNFAYFLICKSMVLAGFCGEKSTGKYYTIQLPNAENNCFCIVNLVMTILAKSFPEDVDRLRTLFTLGSNYSAGDETIFEE